MSADELLRLAAEDPERAYEKALAAIDATVDDGPRIAALRAAALAAKELGRLDEGIGLLHTALAAAEKAGLPYQAAQAQMNLVGLLTARGDLAGALTAADIAAPVLTGTDADRLAANRACALARSGRLDEALADVNRALELEPRNGRYRYLRAGVYGELGAPTAARLDAEVACEAGVREACRDLGRRR